MKMRVFVILPILIVFLWSCSATSDSGRTEDASQDESGSMGTAEPGPRVSLVQQRKEEAKADLEAEGESSINKTSSQERQRKKGQQQAKADLKAGRPMIRSIGLPDFSAGQVDPETGLFWSTMGCCINSDILAFVEGYNAEIERAIRAGELEGGTFKSQMMTKSLAEKLMAGKHEILPFGGDGLRSPDGRFRLLLEEPQKEDAHHTSGTLCIVEIATGRKTRLQWLAGPVNVVFTHDGKTAVVSDDTSIKTYDLALPCFLQGFRRAK